MEKIRVLQINSVYKVASTGRTCWELCEELEKSGHFEVKTACKNSSLDPSHTIQIGNLYDYKIHGLLSRITGLPSYFSQHATGRLIKEIEKYSPDIVHLRNLHSNHINVPMLLSYLGDKDIATVVTLHDCFLFTGKCVHPSLANCRRYKKCCGNCPQLKHGNKSWFFDKTEKMLSDRKKLFERIPRLAVVGVSNWVTSESEGSLFDCACIRKTIYNWVDYSTFKPNVNEHKDSLPVVLGVASHWEESKGYKEFCEFAKLLRGKANIVLVGDIEESDKVEGIIYHGVEKDPAKLAKLYSDATVFFNPTKVETFGKVSAEALACGTPVVAYDVSANSEIIGDKCGYVVPVNNIEAAVNKIEYIISVGKQIYSQNCIDYVKRNFDIVKNTKLYAELYQQLLEKR